MDFINKKVQDSLIIVISFFNLIWFCSCMRSGNPIVTSPNPTRGLCVITLVIIFCVASLITDCFRFDRFHDEFWLFRYDFGLSLFFKSKSRILGPMKNYIFKFEWLSTYLIDDISDKIHIKFKLLKTAANCPSFNSLKR